MPAKWNRAREEVSKAIADCKDMIENQPELFTDEDRELLKLVEFNRNEMSFYKLYAAVGYLQGRTAAPKRLWIFNRDLDFDTA